jgi:hypothetical protein
MGQKKASQATEPSASMGTTRDNAERSRRTGQPRGAQRLACNSIARMCLAALALLGCGVEQAPTQLFSVTIDARDERGESLPELVIASAGAAVGRTDAQGRMRLGIRGRENSLLQLEPRCPSGYRATAAQSELRLPARSEVPLVFAVTCARENRVAALLVNAPGFADLPVLVAERVVARTNEAGSAHVLLEGAPGTQLRVVLDTSTRPKVAPRSPERTFTIGSDDTIELFDPALSEDRKKKRRSRKERTRASRDHTRARDH